MKFDNFKENP